MLTLDRTTLFYYSLSNTTIHEDRLNDWVKTVPKFKRGSTRSVTPSLTNGSTRTRTSKASSHVSTRSALNNVFIRQRDVDVADMANGDGGLSDHDETKGPEREAAIKSPPKGKKRVTSSVSNKLPLYFIFPTVPRVLSNLKSPPSQS